MVDEFLIGDSNTKNMVQYEVPVNTLHLSVISNRTVVGHLESPRCHVSNKHTWREVKKIIICTTHFNQIHRKCMDLKDLIRISTVIMILELA